jgi:hypothetical protein
MMQRRTSFNNYGIAQRLRPCNLHSPLSLRINAIVDDYIAVAVALIFAKLSINTLPTRKTYQKYKMGIIINIRLIFLLLT